VRGESNRQENVSQKYCLFLDLEFHGFLLRNRMDLMLRTGKSGIIQTFTCKFISLIAAIYKF
jgi:hypothetical protein